MGQVNATLARAWRWLTEADALAADDHRPWPLPSGAWVMAQTWNDLLFAHWPVRQSALADRVPAALPLDTFDGEAWVGITPFVLTDLRPRTLPPAPWMSAFPEINVRTYVRRNGKGGVFFFSLDAGSALAVVGARWLYALPYHYARFDVAHHGTRIRYVCHREERGAAPAAFEAEYEPAGPVARAAPDTLEAWLTERYCLYTVDAAGAVSRAEIHHEPWPLRPARAEIRVNTMAAANGLSLPARPPLLHFAQRLQVNVWLPARIDARRGSLRSGGGGRPCPRA